ncbi:putative methionine--tRNA ligase [Elsinoe australis]|uniref:Probable methionine--tRNA ligase, mitochondrial n=1 Tax=Elsinoe australis TaxID=40998 RepID=A0A4V6DUU9_9PEZI|nr:putative methionine--tRNA ligase [Elsinoe australis]
MVLADVMKRWQVLRGREAILCTGTDEHGLKIQQAAQKAGVEPQAFCDRGAKVFKSLAQRANISYDHFVRTSDKSHKDAVEYAWTVLQERGYIYRSKHEGWYAVSDEAFYPDSAVHLILDPSTGRKLMVSKETNNEVQWSSEDNYHFRLSAFRDRLLEFYKENPTWITPAHRMKSVIAAVEEGLEDLSVSRPYERLKWAVRVPTDSSQSMYVWLDALLNYATKAGYPWPPGSQDQGFWPADIHVIGKDIVRFHCIYWPAFLMALDLPMPKKIMTHAHWTMDDRKMSKSIGNVVNPFWAMDRFSEEIMRYFLIHHGGLEDDSNYDNSYIVGRYKNDLQDRLGNLASRVIQSSVYEPKAAKEMYAGKADVLEKDCLECQMEVPERIRVAQNREVNWNMDKYRKMLTALPQSANEQFENMAPNKALHTIISSIFAANAFLQNHEPWKILKRLKKEKDMDPVERDLLARRLSCTLFLMLETLRIVGIMLQPFMPEKAGELLDMLQVEQGKRMFQDTQLCSDSTYCAESGDKVKLLFPPLANVD